VKIWSWIVRMLKRLLGKNSEVPQSIPAPIVEEKRKEAKYRVIKTSRGGPNMPKRQPCPECRGWRRRQEKTTGGAWYRCSRCDVRLFEVCLHPR